MASLFPYLQRLRRRYSPTAALGRAGVAIWGGYVEEQERNSDLASRENRFRTYSDIIANTSIVAAGVRHYLNLIGSSPWSFTPADVPDGQMYADRAQKMLTEDPKTPFHRIVRRASMYRFYGFSIQEWTAKRHKEGYYTIDDIAPRAQRTIERWDVDEIGDVLGCTQRAPQTQLEIYLPRGKVVYLVDDSLHDSPEGLGVFRHLVESSKRLTRYEQLEGAGFETDLRGVPIGRAPLREIEEAIKAGDLKEKDRDALLQPLQKFLESHIKGPRLGMLLDSAPYESNDEAGSRPSSTKQWSLELLQGSSTSFMANAAAIDRVNREMARVLGVEQLLLGTTGGSYALSQDKTQQFFMIIDGALTEIGESVQKDVIERFWRLNGWPEDTAPKAKCKSVRFADVEQIARTLKDMAAAGVMLDPDDPIINDVRNMLGVSHRPDNVGASLIPAMPANPGGAGGGM